MDKKEQKKANPYSKSHPTFQSCNDEKGKKGNDEGNKKNTLLVIIASPPLHTIINLLLP